ncbi:MAG: hypothetical protein ACRDLM_10200 [Gaiellaceae bacterium]
MDDRDAAVFHRYAEYLWRRAGGIVLCWTIAGAFVGTVLGSVMFTSWANWPVHHRQVYLVVLLGAVAGCVLGRSLGVTRAMGLRLQAELAQHQLQFERSTLARAAEAAEQKAPLPAPPPYVPVGVPPVSIAPPVESTAEAYGWAAFEPTGPV